MKSQPSTRLVAFIFAVILLFLAYHVKGQPPVPSIPTNTAMSLEATHQQQRAAAIHAAAIAPPPVIFVSTNTIQFLNTNRVAIRDGTAKQGNTSNVLAPFTILSGSSNKLTNLLNIPAGVSNLVTNFASTSNRRFYSAH